MYTVLGITSGNGVHTLSCIQACFERLIKAFARLHFFITFSYNWQALLTKHPMDNCVREADHPDREY